MASSIKTKREPYYDNLRAFLIFLVVLGHFCETAQVSTIAPAIRYLIYTFHMPLFIFVTGLFFKPENTDNNFQKGIRFLILYVIMKMVDWVTYSALSHQIREFSLISESGLPWFMFAMGLWFIFTPLILKSIEMKFLIPFSILLALVVGYDSSIATTFMLSRVIVFWPFFLAGIALPRDKMLAFVIKKGLPILGLIIFASAAYMVFYHYDYVRILNPMLSAQHPYADLGEFAPYGFIIRGWTYIISIIMGLAAMFLIPRQRLLFTPLGERTLSVYFFDTVVYAITYFTLTGLHLWQYILLSVFLTALLSTDVFYKPLRNFLS